MIIPPKENSSIFHKSSHYYTSGKDDIPDQKHKTLFSLIIQVH